MLHIHAVSSDREPGGGDPTIRATPSTSFLPSGHDHKVIDVFVRELSILRTEIYGLFDGQTQMLERIADQLLRADALGTPRAFQGALPGPSSPQHTRITSFANGFQPSLNGRVRDGDDSLLSDEVVEFCGSSDVPNLLPGSPAALPVAGWISSESSPAGRSSNRSAGALSSPASSKSAGIDSSHQGSDPLSRPAQALSSGPPSGQAHQEVQGNRAQSLQEILPDVVAHDPRMILSEGAVQRPSKKTTAQVLVEAIAAAKVSVVPCDAPREPCESSQRKGATQGEPQRPAKSAWGQPRHAPRNNTPFGRNSESHVNSQLFERAGIRVRFYSRENCGAVASGKGSGSGLADRDPRGAREGDFSPQADAEGAELELNGIPEAEEDVASKLSLKAQELQQQVARAQSKARKGAPSVIGRKASFVLEQQGEEAVANMEAEEEYQVLGKEVLWAPDEVDEIEDPSCWQRCVHSLMTKWLPPAGARTYSVPLKLGGLSPWHPEHLRSSQCYVVLLSAAAAWSAIHPIVQHAAKGSRAPLTEHVLAVGAALSLFLFTGCSFNGWALAATSQRLSFVAQRSGFLNDLARSSWTSALGLLSLFLLAIGLRLFTFIEEPTEAAIQFASFFVVSLLLTSQALILHRLAAALTGTADFFAEQMVMGDTVAWGRQQWKLTLALFSDANNKLHYGLLVLQLTLVTFVFSIAFEGVIHLRSVLELAPGALMAAAIFTAFGRLSTVAAHCSSIPSMLGRLLVDDEQEDAQLTRLIARVKDSNAGIQILGVRLAPASVSRAVYTVGGIAMFLVLNFKKELRALDL